MSNKIVLGLVLGGILGILDGLTAWFTPAVRAGIVGIVMGSMFKGDYRLHAAWLLFPDHAARRDGWLDCGLRHPEIWRAKPVAAGINFESQNHLLSEGGSSARACGSFVRLRSVIQNIEGGHHATCYSF